MAADDAPQLHGLPSGKPDVLALTGGKLFPIEYTPIAACFEVQLLDLRLFGNVFLARVRECPLAGMQLIYARPGLVVLDLAGGDHVKPIAADPFADFIGEGQLVANKLSIG